MSKENYVDKYMYMTKCKVGFLGKKKKIKKFAFTNRRHAKRSDIQKKTATHPVKICSFEVASVASPLISGI